MNRDDVVKLTSMPLQSPTYPSGPYRFFNRQYLVIAYRSDPAALRAALPEPLELDGDEAQLQWLDLPDGEGFGAYAATAQVIPCRFNGEAGVFIAQMYVDNAPPLAGGREIWGYPMKFGRSRLTVEGDTLTGETHYAGARVALGTMVYKHEAHDDLAALAERLARPQFTLKLIPDIDGKPAIAQLVETRFQDVRVKGAWVGAARLAVQPAVNAPLADLPIRATGQGLHMITDMTLPYGRVVHDYLAARARA